MYACTYIFVVPPDMKGLLTYLTIAYLGKGVKIHLRSKGIHKVSSVMSNDAMIVRMMEMNATAGTEL